MCKKILIILCMLCAGAAQAQTPLQQKIVTEAKKKTWLATDTTNTGSQITQQYYSTTATALVLYSIYYDRHDSLYTLDFIQEQTLSLSSIKKITLKNVTNPADEGDDVFECVLHLKAGTVFKARYFSKDKTHIYNEKELKIYVTRTQERIKKFIATIKKQAGIS